MSSETSTSAPAGGTFQSWQFFVLAALTCATVVTFLVRGHGVVVVVMLAVLMAGTALVGMASLRTLQPLVGAEEDRVPLVGGRTRAALDREKFLTLRAIKELEFDRAMGKLSEDDFREMSGRLRSRASRLMRQLDAGVGYRTAIEHDLAKRLGDGAARDKLAPSAAGERSSAVDQTGHGCANCGTINEADARFCKQCGVKL